MKKHLISTLILFEVILSLSFGECLIKFKINFLTIDPCK